MVRLLPVAIVLIAVVLSPEAVRGQDGTAGYVHERDAPDAFAQRITEPITIDGRLDEAVWEGAPAVTEFTQIVPNEGGPASQRTEVRFLYDDDAIYVGARLHDTGEIRGRLGRRDMSMGDSDWLTVIFDSYHDHRTAYGFEINPAGVRRDQSRAGGREDSSWDPVWEAPPRLTRRAGRWRCGSPSASSASAARRRRPGACRWSGASPGTGSSPSGPSRRGTSRAASPASAI
jgi:hypothetical protein